ncbi:hypothetical protein ES332_D04G010400v1 [Gossypium tomentosum]|uniref:Calcineurin-like phosphoesterase domain-containing protein n=1 Tax=Gossypium tomentosum TaxID=34277 RepID=A0A5D2L8A9_GOSTO|nr:hypothetical protein ES332_D04G010400v1 [Gossypium tomentosum]
MESQTVKWKHYFLYLAFIYAILYFLHTNLLLNNRPIRIKKWPHLPLRFRHDGTFKILQVADMHFGSGLLSRCRDVLPSHFHYCSDLNTTRFLKTMIQLEKPDFVAFTGDNIFGPSTTDAAESLLSAFGPVMESGIPWAAVLGNHDQESSMTREELMSFISLMDYSLGMFLDIDGFGNYNLSVYGAPGSHLANSSVLNLFFLDSGDRETVQGVRTYGWIKESQLNWLRSASRELQVQNQEVKYVIKTQPVDASAALAFFHIPIPEVRQLYYQKLVGRFGEGVACSSVNSGVLKTLVSIKDVKAVFIGHDHTNDFCGNLEGIWFCYGGGFGYHGYGRIGLARRARVILAELRKGDKEWMGVERIKTWKRLDDENLSKIDEQVLWELSPSR